MKINDITHRYVVPIGHTLAWFLGIFLGGGFFNLFGQKDMSLLEHPVALLFYSAVSVYFAFLFECVFTFIDCGAIHEDERFNGKIFNLIAASIFHFFTTFGLVGALISKLDYAWVVVLTIWVVIFKLGVSLVTANIKNWLADVTIRSVTSNKIR